MPLIPENIWHGCDNHVHRIFPHVTSVHFISEEIPGILGRHTWQTRELDVHVVTEAVTGARADVLLCDIKPTRAATHADVFDVRHLTAGFSRHAAAVFLLELAATSHRLNLHRERVTSMK